MELLKRNIHMNKLKGKVVSQITLDEDFNIPENKSDVSHVILNQGEVVLESAKLQEEKVSLKGKLQFEILYAADGERSMTENYVGVIPFDEVVNFPDLMIGDHLQTRWEIEDMTASLVNSRKLRVSAIVTFDLRAESLYDEEAAVEITGEDLVETKSKEMEVVQIRIHKKDTYRIKEEIEITNNKPNIDHLLWRGLNLRSVECKPMDGKLGIRGEMVLFVIYNGEEDHIPIQWLEKNITFSGEIEAPGCDANMISATGVSLIHKEIEAKPDYDGENRIIGIDAVLELDMKMYEEEKIQILSDVYSPVKEVTPQFGEANFESLLIKNAAKCKVSDKIQLSGVEKVLQICHSSGCVKIDRTEAVENGLKVEGALALSILYMSDDDKEPMRSFNGALPFSHIVEADGIDESSFYELTPGIEQLNCVMATNDEVEVRAVLNLDTLVLKKVTEPLIANINVFPLDEEKIESMPGIVGYIVRAEDSLWDIAKKFYTTMDVIKVANGLTGNQVKEGERLLVIKRGEEI